MFSKSLNATSDDVWSLLTQHARKRMAQRGIALEAVELALRATKPSCRDKKAVLSQAKTFCPAAGGGCHG